MKALQFKISASSVQKHRRRDQELEYKVPA